MVPPREIVITGTSVFSPIGIGLAAYAESLRQRQSGVRRLSLLDPAYRPVEFGGEVVDFDPKEYVTPRKSLKVMSRDIQLGFAAAQVAFHDSGLVPGGFDPERLGVIFGADMIYGDMEELSVPYGPCLVEGKFQLDEWGPRGMTELFPLWLLKNLPNMAACHIAISVDARGPNNSITHGEVSSLNALWEACRLIELGRADAILVGGVGTRIHPMVVSFQQDQHLSHRSEHPAEACRPFDADRDGTVAGEGAAAFILETRAHALARGAKPLARIAGFGSGFALQGLQGSQMASVTQRVIRQALQEAGLSASDIGHVNAGSGGSLLGDQAEAQAIRAVLGEVPVTAPKSFFGNLGAATGAVEMISTLLAFQGEPVPPTLNYERPDPNCPVNVINGNGQMIANRTALVLNQSHLGQTVAMILIGE